jgi:hypothetical protein
LRGFSAARHFGTVTLRRGHATIRRSARYKARFATSGLTFRAGRNLAVSL